MRQQSKAARSPLTLRMRQGEPDFLTFLAPLKAAPCRPWPCTGDRLDHPSCKLPEAKGGLWQPLLKALPLGGLVAGDPPERAGQHAHFWK